MYSLFSSRDPKMVVWCYSKKKKKKKKRQKRKTNNSATLDSEKCPKPAKKTKSLKEQANWLINRLNYLFHYADN